MKKLISVLPAPLEYRLLEYIELKKTCRHICLIVGDANSSVFPTKSAFAKNFEIIVSKVKKFGPFFYQSNTIRSFITLDYDAFFIQANFRYLDYWVIILLNLVLRRNLLIHGQGLYRYKKRNLLRSFAYWISISACRKYVFYTEQCLEDLYPKKLKRVKREKLVFANNFIRLKNPVAPESKTKWDEILFIGRLRPGARVDEFLAQASDGSNIVNVVGDGPDLWWLRQKYAQFNNIKFFGAVTDEETLIEISQNCGYGIYPGDAGLSLLHYAGLGLVPVFHNSFTDHCGPEFQYFRDMFDCVCFDKDNYAQALEKIVLIQDKHLWLEYSQKAHMIYCETDKESFGKTFHKFL